MSADGLQRNSLLLAEKGIVLFRPEQPSLGRTWSAWLLLSHREEMVDILLLSASIFQRFAEYHLYVFDELQ